MTQIANILPKGNPLESRSPEQEFSSFSNFLEHQKEQLGRMLTKQEIEDLRIFWKQEYHRSYHLKRKKKERRLTIRLDVEEYRVFKTYAKLHKIKSLNHFIKRCCTAYLEKTYVPRDVVSINALTDSINSIGRNINQVVQKLHRRSFHKRTSQFSHEEINLLVHSYDQLLSDVNALKDHVVNTLNSPPVRLEEALLEFLDQHPNRKESLIQFIKDYNADH